MKITQQVLVLFLLFTVSLPSAAAPPVWAKQISSDDFEMAAPPANGSAPHKRELEKMIEMQNSDRKAACAIARRQRFANFDLMFGRSRQLTADEVERTKPLIQQVMNLTQRVTRHFKEHFARPRPYELDSRIEPCADRPGGETSYPSSHASMAAAASCVLAEIFPEKADRLREYGLYLGEVRVIAGAHHPSDVQAGQNLGLEICRALLTDVDFKRELRALRD